MSEKAESENVSVIYDYDPRNLPPEFLRAIGLIVAVSSQTESILQDFIGALLKIDNIQTLALTTHMSFPLKNDIIKALVEIEAPSVTELDKIDKILDAVQMAVNKRNAIAHSLFAIHPDTGDVSILKHQARGSLRAELIPISVDIIEKEAATIYGVGIDLNNFMISSGLVPKNRIAPIGKLFKRSKKARSDRINR